MDTRSSLPATHHQRASSVVAGSFWMVLLSVALFFLPLINGLVGGLVGGYKVGSVGRALMAAILPALLVAGALWLLLAFFDAPVWGLVAGGTVATLIALADVGIFVGAAIGGALSRRTT